VTAQNDPGAANRELTARIARLTWIGRIASVLAGLAVAAVVVVFLVGSVAPAAGTHRGRGGRGNAMVFAIGVSLGFLLPFLATRRLFRWLMGVRRARWIAELAAKHNCDAERLRRLAEALSELA
jgi:hypothetical protein